MLIVVRPLVRSSLVFLFLFSFGARMTEAGVATLAWDHSSDASVAGYTVGIGSKPGHYTKQINVGMTTHYTFPSLADGTYYIAVRAYSSDGFNSGYSNEVVATIAFGILVSAPSSSCATPDPFASLGGGTCYNGGWLPPGMIPSPVQAPAPVPPPPPPPSGGTTGCATPDPFAAMGGGTCYNGGWLPPGMAVPGGSSAPSPTPGPAPPPTGCSTPDPFAAMGGGTCYNGGWLPPGMSVPGGSTVAPPPVPSSEPAPGTSIGCGTPDPFLALGGGTCLNGGWLPPGMVPDAPPVPDVVVTGTLHVFSAAESLWVIEADDGVIYTSMTDVPDEMLIDGARVSVLGRLVSESPDGGQAELEILVLTVDGDLN
jgi:hypothetical protein